MPDPRGLILTARVLVGKGSKGAPNQMRLRRAVSTAYYALFHAVVRAGTDTFVGVKNRSSAGYETVYRSFDHRTMREGCAAIDKPTLSDKTMRAIGSSQVSQEIRDVANAFVALQKRRHWADYVPSGRMTRSEAGDIVDTASLGIANLFAASLEERRNFLAYLMCGSRL